VLEKSMSEDSDSVADNVYSKNYEAIFNSGAIGIVAKWTHLALERGKTPKDRFPVVLEVGAGQGQHLKYVRHDFDKYFETDLRPSLLPERKKFGKVIQLGVNAESLANFPDSSVDRVIASCVLIHLNDPEKALREWHRVLQPSGSLDVYIAPEPGWLLRLARRISTGRKLKKLGMDYPLFHYREHRYSYPYLKAVIISEFSEFDIKFRSYPIPGLSWNFSLWKIAHIGPRCGQSQKKRD
jgi:phosphatidylethanolamine/phosphatidyl-N-methylethanolamine N-methyltransferase